MNTHFDKLLFYVPQLGDYKILDVGSGRGKFLVTAAKVGAVAYGLEPYAPYIEISMERAMKENVKIQIKQGSAENIPYESDFFDFANLSEVVEHVENPTQVMSEVFRVLKKEGSCYVSLPNRYCFKDPHFHLLFVNWIPRSFVDKYIHWRGRDKDYNLGNGRQRLSMMHYYTFSKAQDMMRNVGFFVEDMRIIKLKKMGIKGYFMTPLYLVARLFYFNTLHLILRKRA